MPNYNNNNIECEGFKIGDVVTPAPNIDHTYNLSMIEGNAYVVTGVSFTDVHLSGEFKSSGSGDVYYYPDMVFNDTDVVHASSTIKEAVDKPKKGLYIKTHTLTKLRSILNLTVDYPMTVMNYNIHF
ncbi:hypothetical protein HOK00_04025, partial [bacterium]|nr:hypothetical protein [bacterium]